jgi:hypothetical protein
MAGKPADRLAVCGFPVKTLAASVFEPVLAK